MKALNYIPLYTYEDYRQWEGEWELIGGHPHAMSPSPKRKHQYFSGELTFSLKEYLKRLMDSCGSCRVYQDLDWIVDDSTVVRPDIMVVCGEFKDDFLQSPPALIVEILSPSTALKDKNIKYNLYEAQGVRYYLLVEPDSRSVQILELVDGAYAENNSLSEFRLTDGCVIPWKVQEVLSSIED